MLELIRECLEEVGIDPTMRRIDGVYYTIMWEYTLRFKDITKEDVHQYIKDTFNFKRVKATKLARKMYSKDVILGELNGFLIIRDFKKRK